MRVKPTKTLEEELEVGLDERRGKEKNNRGYVCLKRLNANEHDILKLFSTGDA